MEVELTEDGLPKPRWGLGEAFGGFAIAIVVGGLFAGVILAVIALRGTAADPRWHGRPGRRPGRQRDSRSRYRAARSLALDALQQLPFWAVLLLGPVPGGAAQGQRLGARLPHPDEALGHLRRAGCRHLLAARARQRVLLVALPADRRPGRVGRRPASSPIAPTTSLGVILLFLIVGVGAPIAEEVFFRGLALRAFRKKGWAWWPSIIVTALYFGATHLQPLQFPALVIFGIAVGWLVQRTEPARPGRSGPMWASTSPPRWCSCGTSDVGRPRACGFRDRLSPVRDATIGPT